MKTQQSNFGSHCASNEVTYGPHTLATNVYGAGGTAITPNPPSTYGSTINTGTSAGLSEVTFRKGRGIAVAELEPAQHQELQEGMSGSYSSSENM